MTSCRYPIEVMDLIAIRESLSKLDAQYQMDLGSARPEITERLLQPDLQIRPVAFQLLNAIRNQRCPAGLVAGSEAFAGVAVEVFVEQ